MSSTSKRKRQSSRNSNASRLSNPKESLIPLRRPGYLSQQGQGSQRNTGSVPIPLIEPEQSSNGLQADTQLHKAQGQRLSEDNIDEISDHIIMALDMKERATIGCAYYVVHEQRLFCMEDISGGGYDLVESLKLDIQPTVILVSPRLERSTDSDHLRRHIYDDSLIDNEHGQLPTPWQIDYRPSPEFSYDGARNKLVNLQSIASTKVEVDFLVPGESSSHDETLDVDDLGLTNRQGRLLQVSALLDMDNKVSIGCVGAVITNLQRRRASEYLQDDPNAQLQYCILDIEMFSLKGTMLINADTLISLQIIQPEMHPNAFNQGPGTSGSKESLSIYGLFHHHARTSQGRLKLRQYFTRPSLDIEEINSRLDFISVFVRPENIIPAQKLSKSMARIKDMRKTMTLLHKGVNAGNGKQGGLKSGVWASVLEFCYHTIDIADTLREVIGSENLPLRARAMDALDIFKLQRIGKMVYDAIDLDSSVDQRRTVIKAGIDKRLDEVKGIYDSMDQLLSQTAIRIAATLPFEVDINVIYFPQLGFHIAVPIDELTRQPVYDGGDQPWERMFTTQNTVYFKDARMHEMDEQLGDLYAMICELEIEISHNLAQKVLLNEKLLVTVSDICGELDCLLALAQGASQYKLTRPRVTEDNIIDIRNGRHLLQEMTVASYVPNDAYLVGGKQYEQVGSFEQKDEENSGPSMILLTGPNYSGKSVYQKSVALIVYMAHMGSFIPADKATIGLTDKIFTRISTRETVSKAQSAFMIDVQQLALALNQCTPRSLIIIDEFGKGTDSCDGAGLAAGALEYFLSLGNQCPKILAATHFYEIFQQALDPREYTNLSLKHMEVRVDQRSKRRAGDHDSEVTYLYNLMDGRSNLSYGTQCASMNGIPQVIVDRAKELAEWSERGEDLVSVCARLSRAEEEDLENAEMVARAFLEADFDANLEDETEDGWRNVLGSVLRESMSGSFS